MKTHTGRKTINALTFSYARQNLVDVMRTVNDDHAPVVVTHQNAKPVVIISLKIIKVLKKPLIC
jgi:antitoxin YefM